MDPLPRHLAKRKSATFKVNDMIYTIVASSSDTSTVRPVRAASSLEALSDPAASSYNPTQNHQHSHTSRPQSPVNAAANELGSLTIQRRNQAAMSSLSPVTTLADEQDAPLERQVRSQAVDKLRLLLGMLEKGEIAPSIMQSNIEYAISVLENFGLADRESSTLDNSDVDENSTSPTPALPKPVEESVEVARVGMETMPLANSDAASPAGSSPHKADPKSDGEEETDGEFSEVHQELVPPEVREWLASTFTRQSALLKRRGNGQVKFRAVANVIRMGIMVEKMSRKASATSILEIPPGVTATLRRIDNWSFDVFRLNEVSNNSPLRFLGYELFARYGFFDKFKISANKLDAFLQTVELGYSKHKNPYHNGAHAADVTQTVHYILSQMGLMRFLTDLEALSLIISGIIHDVEHTGTTNNFHVNSSSETALIYNDKSVLENHHVFTAFKAMRQDECNFLCNLTRDEFRELRSLVVDMVLATDMSSHFMQIKHMKNYNISSETVADKSKILNLILHCCDISHPSKDWELHSRWTGQLLEEFFLQGDLEKQLGLPISPLCDRTTTLVPESQIGFIEFIVEPSMSVCGEILENIVFYLRSGDSSVRETASSTQRTADPLPWVCRPWDECLSKNKSIWKQQKQEADALKEKNASVDKGDSSDESSNIEDIKDTLTPSMTRSGHRPSVTSIAASQSKRASLSSEKHT